MGEKWPIQFCLQHANSTVSVGIFYMLQIYDMGQTALLPLRRTICGERLDLSIIRCLSLSLVHIYLFKQLRGRSVSCVGSLVGILASHVCGMEKRGEGLHVSQ
jgi:hypothetical protein